MAISSSALAQTNTNTPVPTPSPTPTVSLWRSNDPSVSTADKIAAAQAELDDVSLSQHARKAASLFLLQVGAIQPDAAIQDPSLGGKIVDAKLQAALASSAKVTKGVRLLAAKDYAGTIAVLTQPDVLGSNPYAYQLIADAKRQQKAPDAVNWAKAAYAVAPFSGTRTGVNLVNSALLAKSGNLNEANQFLAYQATGEGVNPLAEVAYPDVLAALTDFQSETLAVYGKVFKGQNAEAVRLAISKFVNFTSPSAINNNVDLVASVLRDIDGNVVRANAYVEAQKNGTTFTFTELQ